MSIQEMFRLAFVAGAVLLAPLGLQAQDALQDHSCTVGAAGGFVSPFGKDGNNFNLGWTLQAGGGFAVIRPPEPHHGVALYITANYMYAKLGATSAALTAAKTADPTLASATSAHGSFSAVTVDPTVRFPLSRRVGPYASGGFGWFRRDVGFNGVNAASLLESSASTLDRVASNSGVFDLGGGINIGLTHNGGLMVYTEVRVYRGAAINSTTTLLPVSAGLRW